MPSSGLSWSDVTAIVGAAAWIPQIIKLFQKPQVSLIVGRQIEIGFTGVGSILNPTIAFRSEKTDALITDIFYEVQHERGQSAMFVARQLTEPPNVMQLPTGDAAFFQQKTSQTVAVIMTPTTIVERKVSGNVYGHVEKLDELMVGYQAAIARFHNNDPDLWYAEVSRSAEYQAILKFMDDAFFWMEGSYTIEMSAIVRGVRKAARAKFEFRLNKPDVDLLRQNRAFLATELLQIFWEAAMGKPREPIRWKWLYRNV